jgi:hypothetical protein
MGIFTTFRCMNTRTQPRRSIEKCQKVELSRCRLSMDSALPAKAISVIWADASNLIIIDATIRPTYTLQDDRIAHKVKVRDFDLPKSPFVQVEA